MAKIIGIAVVVVLLFAGLVIVFDKVAVRDVPTPSPSTTVLATPTEEPGTTGNIRVFSPQSGDEVGLPLVIKGEARTFEAAFSYRVKNSIGTVLVEGHSMTTGETDYPAFRPFEVTVNYPEAKTATGSVEVFEYSAKDGTEINKVVVPVKFKTIDSMSVKAFFSVRGKSEEDCDFVQSVTRRIARTATPVRASLDELLRGVYVGEVNAGYFTSINSGVTIKSVNLSNSGVLTIDFDRQLQNGVAGSCRVQAIRAQIEQTAKQFSTVKSVVISVEGRTEDVLQP